MRVTLDERRTAGRSLAVGPGAGHRAAAERRAAATARHHPRPEQALRQHRHLRSLRSRHSARRVDLGVRSQWLRQEHADQHDRRPDAAGRRADPVRRPPPRRDQVRLCVSELPRGAVSVAARVRQHRLSAEIDAGGGGGTARPHRGAGGAARRQARPETLSVSDVRRPAAARLDHARAGGRSGDSVPRRAVLRARLRDDAVHARAAAAHFSGDRHHDGAGVARSGRGGVSRRPGIAAVAPPGAGRRLRAGDGGAPAHRRDAVGARTSSPSRRTASTSFSARCGGHEDGASQRIAAGRRRGRASRRLVARGRGAVGRSGAAAVAGGDLQGAVEGHGRRRRSASTSSRPSTAPRPRPRSPP